jgi:hypothetical protein
VTSGTPRSSRDPRRVDGPYQLVSLRHDFPDAWYRYQACKGLSVDLTADMDILPCALRSGMKPDLEAVKAIHLPKGAAAEMAVELEPDKHGSAWTIEVSGVGAPAPVDDIYLLTRFKLQ